MSSILFPLFAEISEGDAGKLAKRGLDKKFQQEKDGKRKTVSSTLQADSLRESPCGTKDDSVLVDSAAVQIEVHEGGEDQQRQQKS